MEKFIESLNLSKISSEDVERDILTCQGDKYCDCPDPDDDWD